MSLCVHIQIVPSRSLEKQNYRVIGRGLIKVAVSPHPHLRKLFEKMFVLAATLFVHFSIIRDLSSLAQAATQ